LKEIKHYKDLGVDGDNIKIDHTQIRLEWSGFIWLRIETSGWFCEHDNEPLSSVKCWEFLPLLRSFGFSRRTQLCDVIGLTMNLAAYKSAAWKWSRNSVLISCVALPHQHFTFLTAMDR
jgi:hypothetical protein